MTIAEQLHERGRGQGKDEGFINATKILAPKLFDMGISDEEIAKLTNLPLDIIKQMHKDTITEY